MNHARIPIPEHWTPDQVEAAVELLEIVLIDMWEQYELVLTQLRQHHGSGLEDDRLAGLEHLADDDIPF